jgi:hypothetical protein
VARNRNARNKTNTHCHARCQLLPQALFSLSTTPRSAAPNQCQHCRPTQHADTHTYTHTKLPVQPQPTPSNPSRASTVEQPRLSHVCHSYPNCFYTPSANFASRACRFALASAHLTPDSRLISCRVSRRVTTPLLPTCVPDYSARSSSVCVHTQSSGLPALVLLAFSLRTCQPPDNLALTFSKILSCDPSHEPAHSRLGSSDRRRSPGALPLPLLGPPTTSSHASVWRRAQAAGCGTADGLSTGISPPAIHPRQREPGEQA